MRNISPEKKPEDFFLAANQKEIVSWREDVESLCEELQERVEYLDELLMDLGDSVVEEGIVPPEDWKLAWTYMNRLSTFLTGMQRTLEEGQDLCGIDILRAEKIIKKLESARESE